MICEGQNPFSGGSRRKFDGRRHSSYSLKLSSRRPHKATGYIKEEIKLRLHTYARDGLFRPAKHASVRSSVKPCLRSDIGAAVCILVRKAA